VSENAEGTGTDDGRTRSAPVFGVPSCFHQYHQLWNMRETLENFLSYLFFKLITYISNVPISKTYSDIQTYFLAWRFCKDPLVDL
jgi:hypothetical protein